TPTAALAGVVTGHATAYTVLGHPTAESLRARRLDPLLFRTTVRRVRAPLALSASAAAGVAELTGVRPQVVPPGLRTAQFPLVAGPRSGPPTVLFASDAGDRRKGLDLLLAAFVQLLDEMPDCRLVLAGGGDTSWAFAAFTTVERMRIRDRVDDVGAGELADLPARFAAAWVTVLPSLNEAFGLVLVESMATGTPVVACASGGPTEIVDRPEVGRLAPPGDPAALAAALQSALALAADPDTAHRCAQQARRWDWGEVVGPAHLEVYERTARASRISTR
ncbi:MAG TPA: glycosyltransferase, partial [Mycobacteriales bacterium]|nr:glycosyltransferase [Mycobacteriales bacterium]